VETSPSVAAEREAAGAGTRRGSEGVAVIVPADLPGDSHGDGRLALKRGDAGFADYLYWFHFANGTLQPLVLMVRSLERVDPSDENAPLRAARERFGRVFSMLGARLGEAPYLAGAELAAAGIMSVFTLTTMRLFKPYDLAPYPNVLAYLQRIGARPAYRRAMQKADPDLVPVLGAVP